MKSNKYAQKPSQGYQVMSSGWFEQQSLWPSIRLHFDAVGFIAGKSQSVGGKIKGGSGCKICQMLLLACRTTVHHPLGCIVHWKHGSHSPRQAYYRKLHQSTPKDSWQLLLQAICLALYCRKEARPEKKGRWTERRTLVKTDGMTEWTNLLGHLGLWRRMGKKCKWSRTMPNPYPRPLSGTLRSHRDLKRRKIRGHGVGMLCGCTRVSWSAKPRKLQNFADLFGTSLLFHGSPRT